ncbi:MAG: hypothetical protein OXN83_01855 [Oligoflexia bacterium]|nr:hypothetical protein [Oligoflexia bacterium]
MREEQKQRHQALKKIAQYLSLRSHSEKELKQKLSKKFSTAIIEEALNRARQKNWLEKPSELSQKAIEQLHQKNKSWEYIQAYFKKKELPLPAYNKEKELEKARKLLKKQIQSQSLSHTNPLKLKQFLANRSFETDIIDTALEELAFDR